MTKVFYDHLILKDEVLVELDKHGLTVEEKTELTQIIDATLHHHVLDEILTHLPKHKHQEFLGKMHAAPHDTTLLEYLKIEAVADIEEKITTRAKKAKTLLLGEIHRAKKG